MNKELFSLHKQTLESIRKANDAIRHANEALNEATTVLKIIEELSDDDLNQVTGAGDPYEMESGVTKKESNRILKEDLK